MLALMAGVWLAFRGKPQAARQAITVSAAWTTAAARDLQRIRVRERAIAPNLNLPVPEVFPADLPMEQRWEEFLQAVLWQVDRRPEVLAAVRRRLQMPPLPATAGEQSIEVQRLVLEAAYGLFPDELLPEMQAIFSREPDSKRVAMAGAWLARQTTEPSQRAVLLDILQERHPEYESDPRLLALYHELVWPRQSLARLRPDPAALLTAPFDGRPVVFSFQRRDRRFTGRAAVRHAQGDFLVNPDGTILSVPQFALSASGLPGTITNGNTPCGIFEITEIGSTRNHSIGPSPTLVLGLPLEYDRTWTQERYLHLLPDPWKTWWPMREAWWAGQAGRYEILAHGTAIDPAPWSDTPFAGETPSQGCLTCRETWDPVTGERLFSAQTVLAEAFQRAGGAPGYLVVLEVEELPHPVSAGEVSQMLRRGSRKSF